MHERFIASQQKLYDRSNNEHLPERDTDNEKHYYMETFSCDQFEGTIPPVLQVINYLTSLYVLSVSAFSKPQEFWHRCLKLK